VSGKGPKTNLPDLFRLLFRAAFVKGGMGTVHLAEHIRPGLQRARKFVSSELSQDASFLKRFRHEAHAAIRLRHPNVAEVVDLDQATEEMSAELKSAVEDAPGPRYRER
jgi:serine/threonine protein kinase